MNRSLVLEVRFVVREYHGRGDFGEPEWPPSPHRALQAWVAAAARAGRLPALREAFRWLEGLGAPTVSAHEAQASTVGYRLSVPHNAMDLVARGWVRGADPNPAEHRTMKPLRPLRLPAGCTVRYAWPLHALDGGLPAADALGLLLDTASSIVALGWGRDLAVARAEVTEAAAAAAAAAPGLQVWAPRADGTRMLRVPTGGSAQELDDRHEAFLTRVSLDDDATLRPVPAIQCYERVAYARAGDPPPATICAFTLLRTDGSAMRAFDTAREGTIVVGRMRHAARRAAGLAGWSEESIGQVVLGHGDGSQARLQWLPIPSIEYRPGGGAVAAAARRVIVKADPHSDINLTELARALAGQGLVDEATGEISAVLAPASPADRGFTRYCEPAHSWTTVTPVVLPGHDDPSGLRRKLREPRNANDQRALLERLAARRDQLLRKALMQAGIPESLAASARIEARSSGFMAGVEVAQRHFVPSHLQRWPRVHVRLSFDRPVRGPLCIGGGRFYGLGLFAAVSQAG
jgi:CRISPR-associated protein Csb2